MCLQIVANASWPVIASRAFLNQLVKHFNGIFQNGTKVVGFPRAGHICDWI